MLHKSSLLGSGESQNATAKPTSQAIGMSVGELLVTARAHRAQVRREEGHALACALGEMSLSRRSVALKVGRNKRIVEEWCLGDRPIQRDRLKASCPVVYACFEAKLAVGRKP